MAGQDQGRTPIRILNPSDSILEIKVREHLADAEAAQVAEGENVEEPAAANLLQHPNPYSHYFTTLDLLSGYWQVGLTESARIKSAFTVRGGLYL